MSSVKQQCIFLVVFINLWSFLFVNPIPDRREGRGRGQIQFSCYVTFSFWYMMSFIISQNSSGIIILHHILRVTVTSFINRFPKFFFVVLHITIPSHRHNYFCSTTYSLRDKIVASCAHYPQSIFELYDGLRCDIIFRKSSKIIFLSYRKCP